MPELKFLDPVFTQLEKLALWHKVLICVLVFGLIIGGYVFLFFLPKNAEASKLGGQLDKLSKELKVARQNAGQLKKFRAEMKKAQNDFNKAKKALPEKQDIPELLSSISRSGQEAGLEFRLFQPRGESVKDFYAEIPVSMKVAGNFHNVVIFFDQITGLSRIVNIKNITIAVPKDGGKLTANSTAVTYRFVDKPPPKKKPTGKKKKRK